MYANSSHAFVKTVTALLTTQQSKLEHLVFLTKNGGCSAQLVRHASGNIDNSLGKLSYSWPNKAEEQQRKVRARRRTLNERNLQSTSTFLWRLQQHENLSTKSRLTCTDRKCQWSMLFFWGSSYVSRFICVFSCPTSQMTNPSIVYADMASGCPVLCCTIHRPVLWYRSFAYCFLNNNLGFWSQRSPR